MPGASFGRESIAFMPSQIFEPTGHSKCRFEEDGRRSDDTPDLTQNCKTANKLKNRVFYSDASDQEKEVAVQCFHAVTNRVKKAWLEKRAAELCVRWPARTPVIFGGHSRLRSTTFAQWNWQPSLKLSEP